MDALVNACYYNMLDVVQEFVQLIEPEEVNHADIVGWTPLYAAMMSSSFEVVCYLLALDDIDVNVPAATGRYTALHIAAYNGRMKYIELLTSVDGVDLNARSHDGNTPLHMAAKSGSPETVAYVLLQSICLLV